MNYEHYFVRYLFLLVISYCELNIVTPFLPFWVPGHLTCKSQKKNLSKICRKIYQMVLRIFLSLRFKASLGSKYLTGSTSLQVCLAWGLPNRVPFDKLSSK